VNNAKLMAMAGKGGAVAEKNFEKRLLIGDGLKGEENFFQKKKMGG